MLLIFDIFDINALFDNVVKNPLLISKRTLKNTLRSIFE